jgi:hypothetical protein
MRIRYFVPLAIVILVVLTVAAQQTGFVPPAPIAAITLAGELLLLFQLEENRVGRFLAELTSAFREAAHHK